MKYILIGVFTLMVTLLVSRIFLAVGLIDIDRYTAKHSSAPVLVKNDETPSEQLKAIGEPLYQVFCSSCHGSNGKGNNGKAHNHTKRIAKKQVLYAINNGSNNFKSLYPSGMPAGLVDKKDAEKLAEFVAGGMKGDKPKAWSVCATCHNEDGEGIPFIAPNLKTYSDEFVAGVLTNGKKGAIGTMPSFAGRLSEIQMRALASHIRSIQK